MVDRIGGLPAHVLLLHVVVVLVPLAALLLVLSALWPAARHKLGFISPLVALVALAFVPLTTHAGEYLKDRLGFSTKAIERHAHLGDELLPWAAGVFVLAAVVWLVGRRRDLRWRPARADSADSGPAPARSAGTPADGGATATIARSEAAAVRAPAPVWVTALLAAASVVVAVGATWMLYRIGDSGARAVWGGVLDHG